MGYWDGSGISWTNALLQTDNHTSTPSLNFYRPDALPAAQPTVSKHWRTCHDERERGIPERAAAAVSSGVSGTGGGGGGDSRCFGSFACLCLPRCCCCCCCSAASVGSEASAGARVRGCSSPLWLAISVDAVSSVNQSPSRNTVLKSQIYWLAAAVRLD